MIKIGLLIGMYYLGTLFPEVQKGDVVINEIMYKPKEGLGLPKVEYLELYNRRDYPVRLDSVLFVDRGTVKDYITATIPADGFLLLCRAASAELLEKYGEVCNVKNFALVDEGATLVLKKKSGQLLDSLTYSPLWIRDKQKRQAGGYALEKIDPAGNSADVRNWYESAAPEGGTPGKRNAVLYNCPDEQKPYITGMTVSDNLLLSFSEPIYEPGALSVGNYNLNNGYGTPYKVQVADNGIALAFLRPIAKRNEAYELKVKGVTDLSGLPLKDTVLHFFRSPDMTPGDIRINEIMYEAIPSDAEYIELLNCSDKRIALTDLCLAKRDEKGKIGSVRAITDHPAYLEPGELFWVCSNPDDIQLRHCRCDLRCCYITPTKLAWSDEGGCILLTDRKGEIMDELQYGKFLHSPLLKNTKGIALERVKNQNTQEGYRWVSAGGDPDCGYGSPGMPNQPGGDTIREGENILERTPEVFTPDGDGYEDEISIWIKNEEQDKTLKLWITDSYGRPLRILADGYPVTSSASFRWDGKGNGGQLVPAGIYVICARMTSVGGRHRTVRKVCVVSR